MLALVPDEHWMTSWPAGAFSWWPPPPEEACVHVLASRLDVYVGITATSSVTARTATSGAACRYWEHLVEIRKPAARGLSAEPSRKVACFRQCRAGHVAMLVVALGPRREVASLESTAIASSGCRGNMAGARGAGLMLRRHRTQARQARSKQHGPQRADLPDALRATVHWLSLADGRRRRSEDREPRREAGQLTDRLRGLPFAEQYAAWQRARWHFGLGEGPVDVLGTRGDTLLAAWFAGTGQVCCESLLQRAAVDDFVALRACDAVQGMRHADGKRRALDRVGRLLRLWRLPARGAKVTRWPGRAAGCTAASTLEGIKAQLTQRGRRLWRRVEAHPGGPPAVPDLFFPLEPNPAFQGVRHARLARHRCRVAAPLRQGSGQHDEGEALLEATGCGRPGPGAAPGPGGGARVGPEVLRRLLPGPWPGRGR